MLILIEGASKSGKTTFCDYLNSQLKGSLFYKGIYRESFNDIKENWRLGCFLSLIELSNEIKKPIIVDRFHLSEFYFSQEYRNGIFTSDYFQRIEEEILNISHLLLFIDSKEMSDESNKLEILFNDSKLDKFIGSRQWMYNHLDLISRIIDEAS